MTFQLNYAMIAAMLIPNIGGWLGAATMAGQVRSKDPNEPAWYDMLKKPSWNPPNWVFGPAWTLLYTMMGYASYLVYKECGGFTGAAIFPLTLYSIHLLVNWMWTPVFFRLHLIGIAVIHLIILDILIVATMISFAQVNINTLVLMLPYFSWTTFATYLNYTIWILNRKKQD